jgi:Glycosyltransferases, probably involved in cell wall biogenesis
MALPKVFNPKSYIKKIQYLDGHRRYQKYFRKIYPAPDYLKTIKSEKFVYQPLISIIVPTYNTKKEFFIEMIESVFCQTYSNWELVIIDDASTDANVRDLIKHYAKRDHRIRFQFQKKNLHISGATNEGFELATGEFVSLLDHDDILWPNALYEIVKALNENRNIDLIYTDEDKLSYDGIRHQDPFLKPDWNSELLLSINYITHFTTIRKKIIDKIGGEDSKYNGAQDWDLYLRATEATTDEKIYHIPKILYSWRIHDDSTAKAFSTKSYVVNSQRNLLKNALQRRGYNKSDYELYENFGIWTRKIKNQKVQHGKVNLDRIKGLALSASEIRKNIGRNSLTEYNYSHAQYNVDGKLFIPEEMYRKYW